VTITDFFREPLQGKTSPSRIFWLYGIVGSLLLGSVELFLNPEHQSVIRVYTILTYFFYAYVIVATYICAKNCKSPLIGRLVRVSAVISLVLLPAFLYLELNGAVLLTNLMEGQLPE